MALSEWFGEMGICSSFTTPQIPFRLAFLQGLLPLERGRRRRDVSVFAFISSVLLSFSLLSFSLSLQTYSIPSIRLDPSPPFIISENLIKQIKEF